MSTALRGSGSCASPGSFIFVGNLARCRPLIAAGLWRGKRILYSPEVHPAQGFIRRDIYDLMILDKQLPACEVHEAYRIASDLAYDLPLIIANEQYLHYLCQQLHDDPLYSLDDPDASGTHEKLLQRIESVIKGNGRHRLSEEAYRFVKDRHEEAVVLEMPQNAIENRVPGSIAKAVEYIVAHCREPLELARVAHVACMSRFHFCRLFKKWTGLPFKSFLIYCRIEIAKRMLSLGVHSVTEVCYAVGFTDLSNFDRTFHRLVGQSPMQYRRSVTAIREQESTRMAQFPQSLQSRGMVGLA